MLKHIKYIFVAALSLLIGGCTDDVLWGGDIDSETEIVVPFRESPLTDVSTTTRAFSSISSNVNHLSLLIFDSRGNYVQPAKSEFEVGGANQSEEVVEDVNGQKGLKLKRSDLSAGCKIYLVANAQSQVAKFLEGQHSENDFIQYPIAKTDILGSSSDGSGVSNAIMTGMIEMETVPESGSLSMQTVSLRRLFSWVTFKVDKECKEFLVTGVRLYMEPTEANFDGSPSEIVEPTGGSYISTPLKATTSSYSHLDSKDAFQMYTLPISNSMTEQEKNGKKYYKEARLLIKGIYRTELDPDNGNAPVFDSNSQECYYSYAFPGDIGANHHITLTLKEVSTIGATGTDAESVALENPSTVVMKYEDKDDDINNIVSDGEHVIALPDTIYAESDASSYEFNVIWRAKSGEDINITNLTEVQASNWLTLAGNGGTTNITTSSAESKLGLTRKSTPYKVTLTQNNGSEREQNINFTINAGAETYLSASMVIVQKAPKNINIDNDLNVKLIISGAYSATLDNYLIFVGNNPEAGTKLKGINPDENGGRIRNAGLHLPMPNGGSTKYRYEIWGNSDSENWTLKNNWSGKVSVSGTGKSTNHWVIEFTDGNNVIGDDSKTGNDKLWEYVVAEDALELSNGSKTLTLDLYHTGLIHKVGSASDYYYYEVFKAGNQIWLDRNIGATSAGMAHLNDTYVRGSWPMSVASAGGMYTYTDVKATNATMIPKGWRLPSQGDYEAMTMQGNFSSNRMTAGGSTFFAPTFRFDVSTVKKDGTRRVSSINAYFPHNRTRNNTGNISGDEGAGYYWTSTGTSSEAYKRVMKFSGQNVSAADFKYGSGENTITDLGNKLSLRCVAGENNNTAYKYTCQVKGYTHAFVYYQDENGAKTYLNTWPGAEIAVGDMVTKKYCPFTFESFVKYDLISTSTGNGKGLYVIFNNPAKSESNEDYSNVKADARHGRRGIPFMNGWAYDISLVGDKKLVYPNAAKDYVVKGNWTKTAVAQDENYPANSRFFIKGNLSTGNDKWDTFVELKDDDNDGIWTCEITPSVDNWKFGIHRCEGNDTSEKEWLNSGEGSSTVTFGQDMKVKRNAAGTNWEGSGKEKLTFYFNPTKLTLKVSEPEYKYAIKGSIWNSGGGWSYNANVTKEADGSYAYKDVTVYDGYFGIGKFKVNETINDTNQKDWYAASNSNDKNATPGNSEGNSKSISLGNNSPTDIELKAGTYDILISKDASRVTVTRKVAGATKTVSFALRLPVCDAEKTSTNAMRIWLKAKKVDNSQYMIADWPGVAMTKTSDGKYYYYKNNIEIEEGKTPADYMYEYLFVYGSNNAKTTNDNVSWSSNKHTGAITDATAKAACGNPDYLYTVWAVSSSEPTPSIPKKTLVVRVKYTDIYPDQEYLYAWTSGNDKPFGTLDNATQVTGINGDYKYWKVETEYTTLSGAILKNSKTEDGTRKSGNLSVSKVTDTSTLSSYGADVLYTVDASSYISSSISYSDKYVNVIGTFNDWKDNGAVPSKNGGTMHTLTIGKSEFKVKTWDGKTTWYSTGGAITQGVWTSITGDSSSMTINGANDGDEFYVEWDWNKNMIKVTKK